MANREKFDRALKDLEHALSYEKRIAEDSFYFSGISKAYEVALEYAWKYFKALAHEENLEPYSPREAVKVAGQIQVIEDVELWLSFLRKRNLAVHDYIGVDDEGYLEAIKAFLQEAKKL